MNEFDYIIVGSGAGGGPLAARLAEAGKRVLVLEAGADHTKLPVTDPAHEVTRVPSLHGVSTEHEALAWRFFVKHYADPPTGRDPKWHDHDPTLGENETHDGIFYPRAAALGGCTVHNAMITIAGPNSDWDQLADFLGDESWRGSRMRAYFQKLEHNDYSPPATPVPTSWWRRAWDNVKWLFGSDPDHSSGRHGFKGWLHTSVVDLELGLHDKQLVKMLKAALWQAKKSGLEGAWSLVSVFLKGRIKQWLDPNHVRTQTESPEGLALVPLAMCGQGTTIHQNAAEPFVMRGHRSSPRELLLKTKASHPDNLEIRTECFVTKLVFDDTEPTRVVGVEYKQGARLYKAHVNPLAAPDESQTVCVRTGGEVILCGGTFNTPQLLMLSGIGDREQLDRHNIPLKRHLPGVGKNLQDRYEVTVISEMEKEFSLLNKATFSLPSDPASPTDPHLQEWRSSGTGLYSSNGAVLSIFKRSRPELAQPDLFMFGTPLPFEGYKVGWSKVGDQHNFFTWVILKSHTNNHDGTVELRTNDPFDTPLINFHYFNETSRRNQSADDPDLAALVEGVKFVRSIAKSARVVVRGEQYPGQTEVPETNDARMKDWIRRVTWGHHACGTCRMGPDGDSLAVLDSRFKVRGVKGLRVVDASVFPKIPGYFIVANIYMVSEKAADVILEDAVSPHADSSAYPRELRQREEAVIVNRRERLLPPSRDRVPVPVADDDNWNPDVAGLGLSGGGVRSATFNLGILQSLALGKGLRKIDFLSTVSGGGYIGSFLGRIFDRLRGGSSAETPTGTLTRRVSEVGTQLPPVDRVEAELTNPDSRMIGWLRKHGNYIAPSGPGDARLNLAVFVRNFLSVHFVIAIWFLGLFGLANGIRYGLFDKVLALKGLVISKGDFPIGHLLEMWLGAFFSPWFVLVEVLLLLLVVPRIVAYWLVSQDRHESFQGVSLSLLYVVTTVLLIVGLKMSALEPLLIAVSLFSSFISAEWAWHRGRNREAAVGSGSVESQRLRTRNELTYDLGMALSLTGGAFVFAVVDTAGHGLQEWLLNNSKSYAAAFAALGAMLTALAPIARMLANSLAGEKSAGPPSTMARIFKAQLTAGLMSAVLLLVPLIAVSFASHALYGSGTTLCVGLATTLLAWALSFILTHRKARAFVNRSSLAQTYGARLARAYLGASNPIRHRPEGADITEVVTGDDVPSIRDYRPHEAGGPLHLINVVINQTVDFTSQRGNRDRLGENFAVSSLGVSVGDRWHAEWLDAVEELPTTALGQAGCNSGPTKRPAQLKPIGYVAGDDHPLLDETGEPTNRAEMLSLREWMGISGAAVGPGRGQTTQLGTALLFGLANLRTGQWWDSGIADAARDGFPKLSFLRRLMYLSTRLFSIQSLIVFEWIARYPGPWERFWYVSDGGFFENLGGYELIRRRVPRIILCDSGADPSSELEDLAGLVRKARIDFDASIEPLTADELKGLKLPATVKAVVGTLDEVKLPKDAAGKITGPSAKRAALFWVKYATKPDRKSVLLYVKATVTGHESPDIGHYHETHPEFPHESTDDQFFDEAQWESYRKLGELTGLPLFADPQWFWNIPL